MEKASGYFKELSGMAKENLGYVLGNPDLEASGRNEKLEGEEQVREAQKITEREAEKEQMKGERKESEGRAEGSLSKEAKGKAKEKTNVGPITSSTSSLGGTPLTVPEVPVITPLAPPVPKKYLEELEEERLKEWKGGRKEERREFREEKKSTKGALVSQEEEFIRSSLPPAIHEVIRPIEREEIQPIVHRDIEKTEVRFVSTPLEETERRETMVHESVLPAEVRPEVRNLEKEREAEEELKKLEHLHVSQSHRLAPQREVVEKSPVIHESVHTKIIEEVQPIIHKEVIEPHLFKEIKPIYEKIIEPPVVTQVTSLEKKTDILLEGGASRSSLERREQKSGPSY